MRISRRQFVEYYRVYSTVARNFEAFGNSSLKTRNASVQLVVRAEFTVIDARCCNAPVHMHPHVHSSIKTRIIYINTLVL